MMGLKNEDIIIGVEGEKVWGMASIAKAIINKRHCSTNKVITRL